MKVPWISIPAMGFVWLARRDSGWEREIIRPALPAPAEGTPKDSTTVDPGVSTDVVAEILRSRQAQLETQVSNAGI